MNYSNIKNCNQSNIIKELFQIIQIQFDSIIIHTTRRIFEISNIEVHHKPYCISRNTSDVDVIYNVSMPVASTEMIANLKALQEMGAISRETIMEKTEYITDVDVEKKRLSGENVSQDVSQKVDNPSKEV